ncbi:MAG: histidine phosphatase family protein [Lactobacillales bacterium]|jgi:probable phosphoglycerate mutase|nr:histidine phosphatase family protein [Lactobacillales bacterium]
MCSDAVKSLDTTGRAEDFQTVKKRTQEELTNLAGKIEQNGGGNVFLVSHGVSILAMTDGMAGEKGTGGLPNGSTTKIVYKNGKFTVKEVGSLAYVEKGRKSNH